MSKRSEDEARILELERRRCRAVVSRDVAVLGALLAEDMIHTHGTGVTEGKAEYLAGMADRFECKSSERSELSIRFYGKVAISTGNVTNVLRPLGSDREWETVYAKATIVWVKQGEDWKLASFHASRITGTPNQRA